MSAKRRATYATRHAWRTVRAFRAGEIPLKSTHQLLIKLPSSSASSMDRHPQCTPTEQLGPALGTDVLCLWVWTLCYCHPPGMKAPGGWLHSLSSPPRPRNCEEAVIYVRSDSYCTFDAILMLGILPRLSSSRSVRELYTAMTQREASVERVCR